MRVICLINTRNHSQYIDECVQSCLKQEIPENCVYEVHAIDAGSTDGTLERLKNYQKSVRLHPRENIGQSGAFNICQELEADVFMFCDGDDRLHRTRLRHIVTAFCKYLDVVMVGNSITEVDAEGKPIRRVYVETDQLLDVRAADAQRLYDARCLLGTSRLAVRKKALEKILPITRTVLFEADEYVFNLLPVFGRVYILGACLTDYRLHSANNYQNNRPSLERTRRYYQVHEQLLACMIEARKKNDLIGQYIDLCEDGLRVLCMKTLSIEGALRHRNKAVKLIMHDPMALGFVNPSKPKQLLFALFVVIVGLRSSLVTYYYLRGVVARSLRPFHGSRDTCLLA